MLEKERHNLILKLVEERSIVSVGDLLDLLGASEATIRRDINALAERPGRLTALALLLSGLWVVSGGLLALVYLSVPAGLLAGSLLAGVPRSFAVAWAVDAAMRQPEP